VLSFARVTTKSFPITYFSKYFSASELLILLIVFLHANEKTMHARKIKGNNFFIEKSENYALITPPR
jgi:hypothetical protein